MSEISNAIRQLCEDKGLSYEVVLESLETALGAAYRKDFGSRNQNIKVKYNPETGSSLVFDVKIVVEDMPIDEAESSESKDEKKEGTLAESAEDGLVEERKFNPKTEIQLSDAILIKEDAQIGDEIKIELEPPSNYGRMAAQTAKQVIIQKIREAERNMIIEEFKDKEGEVLSGVIQRQEGRIILIDLGKTVGVLPHDEQIYNLEAMKQYDYLIGKYHGTASSRYSKLVNRCENVHHEKVKSYLEKTIEYYSSKMSDDIVHFMGVNDYYSTMQVLLQMSDRVNMAHSIENRSPFLDHRLIQYGFSMPSKYKIRNGITKWILKEVSKKFIPKEISSRVDKRGFSAPINRWFKWGASGKYNRGAYKNMVFDDWKNAFDVRMDF